MRLFAIVEDPHPTNADELHHPFGGRGLAVALSVKTGAAAARRRARPGF